VSVADAHCFGVVGDGVHDVRTIFNNNCRGGCVGRARAWESLRRPSRMSRDAVPITHVRYGHACLSRGARRRSSRPDRPLGGRIHCRDRLRVQAGAICVVKVPVCPCRHTGVVASPGGRYTPWHAYGNDSAGPHRGYDKRSSMRHEASTPIAGRGNNARAFLVARPFGSNDAHALTSSDVSPSRTTNRSMV